MSSCGGLHAMCRFQQLAPATEEAGIGRIRPPHPQPRASRKLALPAVCRSHAGLSSFQLYP